MKPSSPILLLHGALGAAASFHSWVPLLKAHSFEVHTLDFSGHGANAYSGPLSMRLFGEDVLAYLDQHRLDKISIFGFSMGGYAALELAGTHPQRIDSILTLGTKWDWTPAQIERETAPLNPDFLLEKAPKYADLLAKVHTGQGWRSLLARLGSKRRTANKSCAAPAWQYSPVKCASATMPASRMRTSSSSQSFVALRRRLLISQAPKRMPPTGICPGDIVTF